MPLSNKAPLSLNESNSRTALTGPVNMVGREDNIFESLVAKLSLFSLNKSHTLRVQLYGKNGQKTVLLTAAKDIGQALCIGAEYRKLCTGMREFLRK